MAMFERIAPGGAPEERGVAGLEAQAERIARDVGAVLVDDRHDAERHPDALHAQAVGAGPAVGDLADGIGQRRPRRAARWPCARSRTSVSRSRSTTVGGWPAASAAATSSALAARISAWRSRSRSAAASRAASFTSVDAVASTRLAALARAPSSAIGSGAPRECRAGAPPVLTADRRPRWQALRMGATAAVGDLGRCAGAMWPRPAG